MKCTAKIVKILEHQKTLEMYYLRLAEYHAKIHTSLRSLDQNLLFNESPPIIHQEKQIHRF